MKRKGITLTEALVALFIAALGMISLLTLFPLGAMQMGQALKDSRSAQAAQEADGLMRWYWAKYETDPFAASKIQTAMDNGAGATSVAGTTGPSYPVLVDPLGWKSTWTGGNATQTRVANYLTLPRTTVTANTAGYPELLSSNSQVERFTVLQDELEYGETQTGMPGSGTTLKKVERGAQYSWSWLLQRPNNTRRGIVNMQVVVYFKRAPFFANAETERKFTNISYTPGTTKLTIPYGATARPELVKGRWIMDSTNIAGGAQLRHAIFYRCVSVENDDASKQLFVELETPIRRSDGGTAAYTGEVVIFNRVAEVFDRPPLVTDTAATP